MNILVDEEVEEKNSGMKENISGSGGGRRRVEGKDNGIKATETSKNISEEGKREVGEKIIMFLS